MNPSRRVGLIGICSDENSSYLRGPASAPPLIREALVSNSSNLTSESGVCFDEHPGLTDLGDRQIGSGQAAYMAIEERLAEVLARDYLPLTLGGDHAITYPILKAMHARHGAVDILHFDAHPDLYDELDGNRLSHACPFARIMEEGLAHRLVQVGIRTLNAHQAAQGEMFGVEIHPMATFDIAAFQPVFDRPLYISFDLDCLDPAFAPGVSHFEPGGFSVREALTLLHRVEGQVIGADIVEYNPTRDRHGMTAMVAAKLVKEIASLMLPSS